MNQSLKNFFKAAKIVLYTGTYYTPEEFQIEFYLKTNTIYNCVKSGRNYPEKDKGVLIPCRQGKWDRK